MQDTCHLLCTWDLKDLAVAHFRRQSWSRGRQTCAASLRPASNRARRCQPLSCRCGLHVPYLCRTVAQPCGVQHAHSAKPRLHRAMFRLDLLLPEQGEVQACNMLLASWL